MNKLIITFFCIFSVAPAHAESTDIESNMWSAGMGVSAINGNGRHYKYISGKLNRNHESGVYLGSEVGFTPDDNDREHIDGNVFLLGYIGFSAGYKQALTHDFAYSVEVLGGSAVQKESSIGSDTSAVCNCQIFFYRPSMAIHMLIFSDWETSFGISRLVGNSENFTMSSLNVEYLW